MENQEPQLEEQKKEFVEPTVTEEASLTEVTLQTGIEPDPPDPL